MAGMTAGIDWASEAHEVCVSEEGEVLERFSVAHDERGIAGLTRRLTKLGVDRVAIERPDGILVERLLAAGLEVLAIHPNQVKAARARFAVAHGKSDRFDAYVLAELARADAHRFRALVPDTEETKALKTLTRAREDLVGVRVELANQLRAQLQAFWPGALLFDALDSLISLAFLKRYPSPADAKSLGPVVLGLVGALGPIVSEIAVLDARIRERLAAHPDAAIFAPLFRDRRTAICPATLIAELGDCRGRYPTEAAMAADAGMSPVALESGKLRVATFRQACDKRLRFAVATLADTTRHWHPWAKEVYRRARARGQDHPHAIRTLGRAWIRVLWRCWQDGVPYDATLHGNSHRLQPARG